jgi:hypothetical protein
MKKSGLADSPFFTPPSPNAEAVAPSRSQDIKPLYNRSGEQPHGRTSEQTHRRTDEPLNKRTDAQVNEGTGEQANNRTDEQASVRADEQVNKRTDEDTSGLISRQSYNIFDAQAEAIELLALRWRKQRGRHITKSEVVRELLGKALDLEK